jgi:hypothetical protein
VRLSVAAWIAILVLTGGFQLFRAAVADGIVFLAMAAALVVGESGLLAGLDGRAVRPRRLVVAGVLALDAAVMVFTPRHGLADGLVVAMSGVLVFFVAWPNENGESARSDAWTPRLKRAAVAWAILGIAFCVWELTTYFLGYGAQGRTDYPALSDILDPILNTPIGRVAGVAAWLAGGVALSRRGRARA